jgi:NifB/MoaA-like Fe-S oxidoreductase
LAEDFHSGKTDVRPKNYPDTCKYCQQRLLCRLDVTTLSADETEEADDLLVEEEYG